MKFRELPAVEFGMLCCGWIAEGSLSRATEGCQKVAEVPAPKGWGLGGAWADVLMPILTI